MNVIDLLDEMGIQPTRVASSKGGEYHSRCPNPDCDGKDRFCVWPSEGSDGRYWCRRCLRSGDAIQFCRDFMEMDYPSACARVGRQPTRSYKRLSIRSKEIFTPKPLLTVGEAWSAKALGLVTRSHQHLLNHPYLLNQGKSRGLTQQSIVDFQLGWNPSDIFERRELWGLPEPSEGRASLLCLPKGVVIPSFRDGCLIRIKIRRHNWNTDNKYPKYHIIAGGLTCPTLYGDAGMPVIVVEAEFDAMLIQQFAKDICCCIALGGVSIRPDAAIDQLLHQASVVLLALDFDEPGKKAYHFWRSTYSHLRAWPVPKGKSPGDAYALGVDLRRWIEAGLGHPLVSVNGQ